MRSIQARANPGACTLPISFSAIAAPSAILLMTFLDFPVYMESYQANHYLTVGAWVGLWFVLAFFGLSGGAIVLARKTWQLKGRAKLVAGYFLGAIAGLLTLGLRFMPVMPVAWCCCWAQST